MQRKLLTVAVLMLTAVIDCRSEASPHLQDKLWVRKFKTLHIDRHDSVEDNDADFLYAICTEITRTSELSCEVRVRVDSPTEEDKKCLVLLSPENAENSVELVSLYRFGNDKAILKWMEVRIDRVEYANYHILDLSSCRSEELAFPVGSTKTEASFINELMISDSHEFDLAIASESACGGNRNCLITYDASGNEHIKNNLLFLNFYEVTKMEQTFLTWQYFIEARDRMIGEIYLQLLDSRNGEKKALLLLHAGTEYVSSNSKKYRVLCYKPVLDDHSTIQCSKFNEYVRNTLHVSVKLPEPVKLVGAVAAGGFEGETTVLVSRRADCRGDECWDLFVTEIRCHEPVITQEIRFDCSGDTENLALRVVVKKNLVAELYYACEEYASDSKSSFNVRSFRLTTGITSSCG